MDLIKDKLRKILKLANEGVTAGERAAADAQLHRLLNRYGLTTDDLLVQERTAWVGEFEHAWERTLLLQIVGLVTNTRDVVFRSRNNQLVFELTPVEASEIGFLFAEHRRELATQLDDFLAAYIMRNDLTVKIEDDGSEENYSEETLLTMLRRQKLARSLDPAQLNRRALSGSADEV